MDFRFGGVAERRLRYGEWDIGVAGYLEIKDLALVRSRRAERANDNGSGNWLGRGKELVG